MQILYPQNPINPKEADEPYQEEFSYLTSLGVACSLFDFDMLDFGEFRPKPSLKEDKKIFYRGWMMNEDSYKKFVKNIKKKKSIPFSSLESYLASHHLPLWYECCKEFTAKTVFLKNNEALAKNIDALNWERYFVKDYVKSNSSFQGSIAYNSLEVLKIVSLIEQYRGTIEGGICIREVEEYIENSEKRYFVMYDKVYAKDNEEIPFLVKNIAQKMRGKSDFYSIDTIETKEGELRLVELGDGQVSDKKSWSVERFCKMIIENLE